MFTSLLYTRTSKKCLFVVFVSSWSHDLSILKRKEIEFEEVGQTVSHSQCLMEEVLFV